MDKFLGEFDEILLDADDVIGVGDYVKSKDSRFSVFDPEMDLWSICRMINNNLFFCKIIDIVLVDGHDCFITEGISGSNGHSRYYYKLNDFELISAKN